MNIPHTRWLLVASRARLAASLVLVGVALGLLASACGGKVIMDDGTRRGAGGDGGDDGTTSGPTGAVDPLFCSAIECTKSGATCTCNTACMGPDLVAICTQKENDTVVCECHFDGAYLGLCAHTGNSICGLPGGCCTSYLSD